MTTPTKMQVSIFSDMHAKKPYHISVEQALDRIQQGKSRVKVEEIRNTIDNAKRNTLKSQLPAVIFSGKVTARGDKNLEQHSGLIVLDFDKVDDVGELAATLCAYPHTYACWLSPSGNGMKALIRIADGKKHREHFAALKEVFPAVDESGKNEERLCFESYDPHLFRNPSATPFDQVVAQKTFTQKVDADTDASETFKKLLTWLSNKGEVFASGSRNAFVFKLAGACCRYGIDVNAAASLITGEFPPSNDFTHGEQLKAVKSAYRSNNAHFGSVRFEREQLVSKTTRQRVTLKDIADLDPNEPVGDVIYGADVQVQAMALFERGYEKLYGIGVPEIDTYWKPKRGELTCLTGIGNMGKSTFKKWYELMRALLYGEKYATFAPEDNPPEEYYHDLVEMLLGCDCTPNYARNMGYSGFTGRPAPTKEEYQKAYDFVSSHFFYLYPKDVSPNPMYVMGKFLELIVKEKVNGVSIDPWNQMEHTYAGRADQYLSSTFSEFDRFAQQNQVFFQIVAHPVKLSKQGAKDYPCPDVFDLNEGAMWNNKMYNILVYHRPEGSSDPMSPKCEFHSKKVKRQKVVGIKGYSEFEYRRGNRRFFFDGKDPMQQVLEQKNLGFGTPYGANSSTHTAPQITTPKPETFTTPEGFFNDLLDDTDPL